MSGKGYAKCELKSLDGVPGFSLELNGNNYGHYPFNTVDIEGQIKMAIDDAKDYGYDGIYFS